MGMVVCVGGWCSIDFYILVKLVSYLVYYIDGRRQSHNIRFLIQVPCNFYTVC